MTDEENIAKRILQTGHWICFSEPQNEGLIIDSQLRISRDNNPFNESSYAVYSIRAEETEEPNWETNQKIATLLTELAGKGNSGKAAINFLNETMDGYTKFKKLKRINELKTKDKRTREENDLLEKLKSDNSLKPFIS